MNTHNLHSIETAGALEKIEKKERSAAFCKTKTLG